MYIPAAFRDDDKDRLHAFMQAFSFAVLISNVDGVPFATHLPFLIDPARGAFGALKTHLARGNPQWNTWANENSEANEEVLTIFQGPHAYISPSYYATEPNVPTWNYAVVHAYGRPRIMSDSELRATLEELVAQYESNRPEPWSTASLSEDYLVKMQRGIVGVEIEITRLEGKMKLGQNRNEADAQGAIRGLLGEADSLAVETGKLMREANSGSKR